MKLFCLRLPGNSGWRKTRAEQQQDPGAQVKDIAEERYSEEERAADNGTRQRPTPLRDTQLNQLNQLNQGRPPAPQSTLRLGARQTAGGQPTQPRSSVAAPQPPIVVHDPQGRAHEPDGIGGYPDVDNAVATAPVGSSGQQDLVTQSSFQPNTSRLSRNLSHKLPDEVGRKLADKAPKTKFEALSKEYRELVHQLLQNPSKDVPDKMEHHETYINTRRLQDVLNQNRLHDLFSLLPGDKIRWIDPLYDHFPCIIAILLLIGWKRWDRFYELFYSQRDRSQNFTRCDSHVPFRERRQLAFLDDETTEQAFYTRQFMFKPYVFVETRGELTNSIRDVKSRLPFRSKVCTYDSERPIYKVEVDVRCIERINPFTESVKPNPEPELYAMKVFKTEDGFRKEMGAHRDMKKAPFKINHAVVSVTAFKHEGIWCSLYPWADQNLLELFNGKYADYGTQSDGRFRPQFVLEQLEGLVCALKLLHHDLDIRHFDIKPDNILVYNLSQGKCGAWKLTDFGLSRNTRSELPVVSRSAYREERSSVPAPRGSGPYQPPEMTPGQTVNSQSDMFSIGAVMLVAWVFMVGGPDAVKAFREARSRGYQDDGFFATRNDQLVLKPEVERWQAAPLVPAKYIVSDWAKALLNCIKRLLNVGRSARPDAKAVYQELRDIHLAADGYPQLWSYEPNFATVITEDALQPATSAHGPSIFDGHDLRVKKLSAPRFTKLEAVNTFTARLSTQWVIFVASHRAYGYRLQKLLQSPEQWSHERGHTIESMAAAFLDGSRDKWDFQTQANANFESACISGDYLALGRNTVTSGSAERTVEFYNLDTQQSRMHDLPADCTDVIVSAKGVLAFVFDDRVEAKLLNGLSENFHADADEKITRAAFSHDGDYLCVWYTLDDEMRWRVFRYKNTNPSIERKESVNGQSAENPSFTFTGWRYVRQTVPSKSFTLRSATEGQNFFACGEDGRFWFINCEKCEPEDAPTMQHNEGSVDFTMPLFPGTLIVFQRHRVCPGVRLWGFTRLANFTEMGNYKVKTIQNWDLWRSTTFDMIQDAQKVEIIGTQAILVVHCSGLLELRLLQDG